MLGAERGADRADRPDPDLLEYLLLSAPDVTGLASVATAVVALARSGTIRLVDAVLLVRSEGQTTVRTISPGEHPSLAALGRATTGGVLLSSHDLELMALTLGPDEAALLLLVEDRWAATLSAAVRRSGARMTAGERVPVGSPPRWRPPSRPLATGGPICCTGAPERPRCSTRSSRSGSCPASSTAACSRSITTRFSGAGCSRAEPDGAGRPERALVRRPRPASCSRACGR